VQPVEYITSNGDMGVPLLAAAAGKQASSGWLPGLHQLEGIEQTVRRDRTDRGTFYIFEPCVCGVHVRVRVCVRLSGALFSFLLVLGFITSSLPPLM